MVVVDILQVILLRIFHFIRQTAIVTGMKTYFGLFFFRLFKEYPTFFIWLFFMIFFSRFYLFFLPFFPLKIIQFTVWDSSLFLSREGKYFMLHIKDWYYITHSCPKYVLIEKKCAKETDHKFIKCDHPTTELDENLNHIKSAITSILFSSFEPEGLGGLNFVKMMPSLCQIFK